MSSPEKWEKKSVEKFKEDRQNSGSNSSLTNP